MIQVVGGLLDVKMYMAVEEEKELTEQTEEMQEILVK